MRREIEREMTLRWHWAALGGNAFHPRVSVLFTYFLIFWRDLQGISLFLALVLPVQDFRAYTSCNASVLKIYQSRSWSRIALSCWHNWSNAKRVTRRCWLQAIGQELVIAICTRPPAPSWLLLPPPTRRQSLKLPSRWTVAPAPGPTTSTLNRKCRLRRGQALDRM